MKAIIIHYSLKKAEIRQKSKIQRILYGYKDHSNRGQYNYEREGIMKKFPYKKIDQRVIIIPEKNKKEVISVLNKNNAVVEIIPIDIAKTYFKKT